MLRKPKWQIPGEPLAARYNSCQGPVPDRGPAVEKHCSRSTSRATGLKGNKVSGKCKELPSKKSIIYTRPQILLRYWIQGMKLGWICFSSNNWNKISTQNVGKETSGNAATRKNKQEMIKQRRLQKMGCVNGLWTGIIQDYVPWRALALALPKIRVSFSRHNKCL
jgi:hypothetical protein